MWRAGDEEKPVTESLINQLQADVAALAVRGGRPVGSAGHRRARAHLVERLGALGMEPAVGGSFELPYEARS